MIKSCTVAKFLTAEVESKDTFECFGEEKPHGTQEAIYSKNDRKLTQETENLQLAGPFGRGVLSHVHAPTHTHNGLKV